MGDRDAPIPGAREQRYQLRLLRAGLILAILLLVNFLFTGLASWVPKMKIVNGGADQLPGF